MKKIFASFIVLVVALAVLFTVYLLSNYVGHGPDNVLREINILAHGAFIIVTAYVIGKAGAMYFDEGE